MTHVANTKKQIKGDTLIPCHSEDGKLYTVVWAKSKREARPYAKEAFKNHQG